MSGLLLVYQVTDWLHYFKEEINITDVVLLFVDILGYLQYLSSYDYLLLQIIIVDLRLLQNCKESFQGGSQALRKEVKDNRFTLSQSTQTYKDTLDIILSCFGSDLLMH